MAITVKIEAVENKRIRDEGLRQIAIDWCEEHSLAWE
jgi:hypothetical protein